MARKLILGSNSPRRSEIMRLAGYDFDLAVSKEEEIPDPELDVYDVPENLSRQKADHILPQLRDKDDFILLTADTVVILEGTIIGKPQNLEEAAEFLQRLSGKTHEVVSGVCLSNRIFRESFSDLTRVRFEPLTEESIRFYIENYEVMDKAGAYAIQEGIGLTGVSSIEGSFYNVMGLPVHLVSKALAAHGIHPVRT